MVPPRSSPPVPMPVKETAAWARPCNIMYAGRQPEIGKLDKPGSHRVCLLLRDGVCGDGGVERRSAGGSG